MSTAVKSRIHLATEIQSIMLGALRQIQVYRDMVAESDPLYSYQYIDGALEGQRILELLYGGFPHFFHLMTTKENVIFLKIEGIISRCTEDLDVEISTEITYHQMIDVIKYNATRSLKKRLQRILDAYDRQLEEMYRN